MHKVEVIGYIMFYFCVTEVKYWKQNLPVHFDETASLLQFENKFYFFSVLSKWLESFVFPYRPAPRPPPLPHTHTLPHDKSLWSFSILVHVITYVPVP